MPATCPICSTTINLVNPIPGLTLTCPNCLNNLQVTSVTPEIVLELVPKPDTKTTDEPTVSI